MVKGGEFYPVRVRWVGVGFDYGSLGFGLDWVRLDCIVRASSHNSISRNQTNFS